MAVKTLPDEKVGKAKQPSYLLSRASAGVAYKHLISPDKLISGYPPRTLCRG